MGVKLVHAVDQDKADLFHPLSPSQALKAFLQTMNPDMKLFGSDQMTKVGIKLLLCLCFCHGFQVKFPPNLGSHLLQ